MTQELTEHAKTILRAIADEKTIEALDRKSGHWYVVDPVYACSEMHRVAELRIAPETRSINGRVFAAPCGSDVGGYCFDERQYNELKSKAVWGSRVEKDIAFLAIIDALEGNTK